MLSDYRGSAEDTAKKWPDLRWALPLNIIFKDIRVKYELEHPDYQQTVSGLAINDIMLLKLQKPAEFNSYVSPICLPDM